MKAEEQSTILSLQFAIFFRDIIERPDLIFSDINSNLMNIFDGMPTILPFPPGMPIPPDVALITNRSTNNEYVCSISKARIDFHVINIAPQKTNAELLNDFKGKVTHFLSYVLSKREATRFGIICRYFKNNKNAISVIKQKYFKESIGDVAELGFRCNRIKKMQDWEINDIVEISATNVIINNNQEYGIYLQRDINNNPSERKNLTEGELKEIASEYLKKITEREIEELLK